MELNLRLKNVTHVEALDLFMYLQTHEHDIEYGENDFGDLKRLFVAIFERDPRPLYNKVQI